MATSRVACPSVSLLPYLQGAHADSPLKLSLVSATPPYKHDSPAVVLDDSDPISRLIEGCFVTDAGSILKKVFLTVQKDLYQLPADDLRTLTNIDINAFWQMAFVTRNSRGDSSSRLLFSSQVDDRGILKQFSPLFYCRTRQIFFHPVCPSCGLPLQLCTDDELLTASGLHPYSTSHKRYLHCIDCCLTGSGEFYIYRRDHSDPLTVKDRWSLIDDFRMVDISKDPAGAFPCVRCPEREGCYESNSDVRSRITPFSFYPFFLLINDAPSLHSLDFLHLASGASFEELEASLDPHGNPCRITCLKGARQEGLLNVSLFSLRDDRFFLEVLYLKLSFLSDVLSRCLIESVRQAAKVRIDKIWVKVPQLSSTLPSIWNFKVDIIDDIAPVATRFGLKPSESEAFAYLGFLWFQVLLQNRRLGQNDLLDFVTDYLARKVAGNDFSAGSTNSLMAIAPENIFWDPGTAAVNGEWLPLWQKACAPGFLLLDAASRNCEPISCDLLIQSIETVRGEVKSAIFTKVIPRAEPLQEPLQEPRGYEDTVLHSIVTKLIDKYRSAEESLPASATQLHEYEDETMETLILSSEPQRAHLTPTPTAYEITETVMLSAPPPSQERLPPPQTVPVYDVMQETMLISPERTERDNRDKPITDELTRTDGPLPSKAAAEDEADELLETVMIAPPVGRRRPGDSR